MTTTKLQISDWGQEHKEYQEYICMHFVSEELQTVVNEVVVRVFGNDELKNLLKSTDEISADESKYEFSFVVIHTQRIGHLFICKKTEIELELISTKCIKILVYFISL